MNTIGKLVLAAVILGWSPDAGSAQAPKPITPDLARLTDGKSAQVFNRALAVASEDDRTFARLDARAGDGGVLLDGVQLADGIIEVDLKGKDVAQQSFLGIAFHVVDWTTLDAVYFRPFNFRGADAERRSHSVQYVSHPANTWQRLRTERPGQFEQAIGAPPDPNGWFHARIVLANGRVEVFVNGAATPSLAVDDLGAAKSGGVALWVGNGSDGAFANLTITATSPAGPPPASTQNVFQASSTGNLARVRAIVEADPQLVHARNPYGLTPLHMTALYDQRGVAEYLIEQGVDVNAAAGHSGTPLDLAYESSRLAFVTWLQSRGARFTPIRFDITQVAPSIRRVAFPWGMMNNVLVFSGSDGAVVVDSGFSGRAVDELRKVITGVSKAGIQYLISTHAHGDHVAGSALAPSPGAIITAASLAANTAGPSITRELQPLKGRSGRTLPAPYTLRTGGAEITLIPRPGLHSDADVIVYFPSESVVAMGDLLLSESVPAVSDIAGYLAFLDDVLDVFPEKATFVSGHGRDLDAAGVKTYRDTLNAMVGIVRTNLAAGRTVEQMVRDDVLKAYKPQYSLLEFLAPDTLIPRVVTALQQGTLK
jgi:glyoxylase-like metal-dependent hydrolase (beta-lactamase superfamily II)